MTTSIDLHGLIEQEAIGPILSAIFDVQNNEDMEIEIITGNGYVLRDLVIEMAEEDGIQWRNDGSNTGAIIIYK